MFCKFKSVVVFFKILTFLLTSRSFGNLQIAVTTYPAMDSDITMYITYLLELLLAYIRKTNKIKQSILTTHIRYKKKQKKQAGLKARKKRKEQKQNKQQQQQKKNKNKTKTNGMGMGE